MSAEEFARLREEAEARAAQPKPPSAPPAFGSKKDIPKIREMTEEEANEHAIRGPVPSLKPLSPTPPKAPALKPPAPKLVPPKKS
jgi:hypothetical protein